MLCSKCGQELDDDAIICKNCYQIVDGSVLDVSLKRSKIATTILCLSLGFLGAHRFYTGHIGVAMLQLLTLGGLGVWVLVDLFEILTDKYTDINGATLVA